MNKSSKILLPILLVCILVVLGTLYYRIFVQKDFLIIDTTEQSDSAATTTE